MTVKDVKKQGADAKPSPFKLRLTSRLAERNLNSRTTDLAQSLNSYEAESQRLREEAEAVGVSALS